MYAHEWRKAEQVYWEIDKGKFEKEGDMDKAGNLAYILFYLDDDSSV
jgi:hypothetical protein